MSLNSVNSGRRHTLLSRKKVDYYTKELRKKAFYIWAIT